MRILINVLFVTIISGLFISGETALGAIGILIQLIFVDRVINND